jgi:hypothetical protein
MTKGAAAGATVALLGGVVEGNDLGAWWAPDQSAGRRRAAIALQDDLHVVVDTLGWFRKVGNVDHKVEGLGILASAHVNM